FGGRLRLYVSRLGEHSYSFDPQGVSMSELTPGAGFSPLRLIYKPGFLVWCVREVSGKLWMIGYGGGGNLYSARREPRQVKLLQSDDGECFSFVVLGHAVVLTGGGSETDFAFEPSGDLFAVVRNETSDEQSFGSKI